MKTLTQLIDRHGVDVLSHLDRDALVPVLADPQAQGDVIVVPVGMLDRRPAAPADAVPKAGVAVVRGEAGGNTHLLLAEGDVRYDAHDSRDSTVDLRLGVLEVGEGATAYLHHPEHAYAGIAPGLYELRRQREQADVIRIVAD